MEGEGRPVPVRSTAVALLGATSSTKIALIAGRTCDNPGFFRQAIKAGATTSCSRSRARRVAVEAMAREAKAAKVPVYMGFIKNISGYVEGALAAATAPPAPRTSNQAGRATTTREATTRMLRAQRRGHAQEHGHPRDRSPASSGACAPTTLPDVICNAKGGKDSPGCDMRTLGGKTDFASVDITLVNSSGTKVRISADRCSGDGCCATVTDTSNGVVLYSQEMVGGERAKKVAAEAAARDRFSYPYAGRGARQAQGVCAAPPSRARRRRAWRPSRSRASALAGG